MKVKYLAVLLLFMIPFISTGCSQGGSPAAPSASASERIGSAVLYGEITGSHLSHSDNIVLMIEGAGLQTRPDANGYFELAGLPEGNQVFQVLVNAVVTQINVEDVQTEERIRIRLEVKTNCQAVVAQMERIRNRQGDLKVDIQPDKWNVDWVNSSGEVNARICGDDYASVLPETVRMVGPEGAEIAPFAHEVGGNSLVAKFLQSEAIGLIANPISGQSYEITVRFEAGGSTFEPVDTITVVGKKQDTEELTLSISPPKWNPAWGESTGNVVAKLRGAGIETIDPATVRMVGPGGGTIAPFEWVLEDAQFVAKFLKAEALSLIPGAVRGDAPVIRVSGSFSGGGAFDLEFTLEIVGPKP